MALNLESLIAQQVGNLAGNIALPAAQKNDILGGLSQSILGSLTQTATKAGGLDQIKQLLTGSPTPSPARSRPSPAASSRTT